MQTLKTLFWLHVILGPIAGVIFWYQWTHPACWDVWYQNPKYAQPALIIEETVLWSIALYGWLRFRKQDR